MVSRAIQPALFASILFATGCSTPVERQHVMPLFGQVATLELHAPGERDLTLCLESVVANAEQAEIALAPDGEMATLNRAAADDYQPVESFDLYRALLLAIDYARASGGAYDPTIGPIVALHDRAGGRPPTDGEITATLDRVGWPSVAVAGEAQSLFFRKPGMELVLDDLAEGFALDVASRGLSAGCRGGQLALGPARYLWGEPNEAPLWTASLPDPRREDASIGTLEMATRAIAAIGLPPDDPGRYFDPRSGRRVASDVAFAVAIGDTAADATLLARSLYALGSRAGGEFLARTQRVEALMLVVGNGPPYLLASTSLDGRFRIDAELEREVEGRVRYLLPPAEAAWP